MNDTQSCQRIQKQLKALLEMPNPHTSETNFPLRLLIVCSECESVPDVPFGPPTNIYLLVLLHRQLSPCTSVVRLNNETKQQTGEFISVPARCRHLRKQEGPGRAVWKCVHRAIKKWCFLRWTGEGGWNCIYSWFFHWKSPAVSATEGIH